MDSMRTGIASRTVCIAVCVLLGRATAQDEEIRAQWASGVVDVSSRSVDTGNQSIFNAVGPADNPCDVEAGGLVDQAWRPAAADAGDEFIEVRFDVPVHAFAIHIHQAAVPGAIVAVSVRGPDGGLEPVWRGQDATQGCPAVLRLRFPSQSFTTNAVHIQLDTRLAPGWNQIDAVELVGFAAQDIALRFAALAPGDFDGPPVPMFGVAWGDYDNDGWPDLLRSDRTDRGRPVLLHNEGDGSLRLRTATLPPFDWPGGGTGHAVLDYDNDGDRDLLIASGAGLGTILRNDEGAFVAVGAEAGLAGNQPTSMTLWLDYDRDGLLDVYIGHWDPKGVQNELQNALWRNRGDGTFEDMTAAAGLELDWHPDDAPQQVGQGGGTGAGASAADFNGDGWPDLYVPVALGANRLLLNTGAGAFVEARGGDLGDIGEAFGLAVGDIDNDGDVDIFQPSGGGRAGDSENLANRSLMLLNLGDGAFVDVTEGVGLVALASSNLREAHLLDIDNDGDLDLLSTDPHFLFLNNGDGTFAERTLQSGIGAAFAAADYDGDGFVDVSSIFTVYRNAGNGNHWLQVELVGVESNRDGIGARVVAAAGGRVQTRQVLGGDGLLSNEPLVHFGLGQAERVGWLEVNWPSGQVDVLEDVPVDRKIRVVEGRGQWYPAPRSMWTVAPPASVHFGESVALEAAVRPALFEPDAVITEVRADLSGLGGPEDAVLADNGDGTFALAAEFVVGGEAVLRDIEVLVRQQTSLGPYWLRMSRNVRVEGEPVTAVLEDYEDTAPHAFSLAQNYPNPFNSGTVIPFALPKAGEVELAVYNLAGQKVATLLQGERAAGGYKITWDGRDDAGQALATGMYLYELRGAGRLVQTRKLLLLR